MVKDTITSILLDTKSRCEKSVSYVFFHMCCVTKRSIVWGEVFNSFIFSNVQLQKFFQLLLKTELKTEKLHLFLSFRNYFILQELPNLANVQTQINDVRSLACLGYIAIYRLNILPAHLLAKLFVKLSICFCITTALP